MSSAGFRRRQVAAAILVGLALGGTAAVALAAGRSGDRETVAFYGESHGEHRRLVATAGDWEAVADGYRASFKLAYRPGNRKYGPKYSNYDTSDLVTFEPASCPVMSNVQGESIVGDGGYDIVPASGVLFQGEGKLTGRRSATISYTWRIPGPPGHRACHGRLVWHFKPADRRPVEDGTWKLRFSDGESERFTVDGGGRVANQINFPHNFCGVSGGVDLFIQPSGLARYDESKGGPDTSLRFARTRASGLMTFSSPGQPPCRLSLSASRLRP